MRGGEANEITLGIGVENENAWVRANLTKSMVYLTSWATIGQWGGNRWCERGGRWSEGLQRLVKEGRLGGKAGWDYRHKRIN